MIILRQKQKEYGIVSDIKYSGIKRDFKKNIGNARVKLADKFDKSIRKDLQEQKALENRGIGLGYTLRNGTRRQDIRRERKGLLADENIRIHNGELGSNPRKGIIYLPEKTKASYGELYHEAGHIKNYRGENGKLVKIAARKGQTRETNDMATTTSLLGSDLRLGNKKAREEILNTDTKAKVDDFLGASKITDSIKRLRQGSILITDEKAASRWGLRKIKNKIPKEAFEK